LASPIACPFSGTRGSPHKSHVLRVLSHSVRREPPLHLSRSSLTAAFICSASFFSASNRKMSPGWHPSASQIASSVENRIARALPVFRIDRLASAIPIRSASSVSVIRRSWSTSSSLTAIATLHRAFEVFAHQRAFREHPRQQERQQHREPAV